MIKNPVKKKDEVVEDPFAKYRVADEPADTTSQQGLIGEPIKANNQKVVPKVGAVTSGMTGMSGMTQGIPTDLIQAIPAHQPDPSVVKTPKPAELPKPKSLNTVTKTKFDELSPAEAAASKPASISTLPYKDRAAAWDKQFAGKKVQVGNYQMALPTFGELQTHALNPTFAAWAEQAGAGKISDDGMFYPYTSTGEIGSHPTFRITQQNGQMQSVPVRYYDPLNTLTLGALGQSGVQPLPQPESNEGFLTGIARGLAQPFVGINKAGVNIGANYGRDAQDKQYLTDANSVLNPTFQSGAGRFIGETASTLPLAAGTAGVGTGLARMVGLGKGLSSVVGGVGAGAALGAAPNINEVYAGGQTPSQAAVNTALGGVGGGISGGAGYNIFKSAMNPAVKVGLQAATDFGIGTATPFASAAINNTQMPTLGQAVQSGAMNMLPTLAMGIGGIHQGMKRNQQKINTQTAVKDAAIVKKDTQAAVQQAKAQSINDSMIDVYSSVRSTTGNKKGGVAFEDIIGVKSDNIEKIEPNILQAQLNSAIYNLKAITGQDLTSANDSEIGAAIGTLHNNPIATKNSAVYDVVATVNNDIQNGNVQLVDVAKNLGLPETKFYTDLIKNTSDNITKSQEKAKAEADKIAKQKEADYKKVAAEQAKIAAEAQKQAELAQQALVKQQAREALPGLMQQVQNPPLGAGTEILHIADLLEGKANFDTGLPVNKNIELATKKVVKSIEETGIDATLKQIEFNKVELKAKLDLKRAAEAEKAAKAAEKAKPKETPKQAVPAEPVKKKEQTLKVTKVTKPKAEPKQKGRPQKQASSNADPDIAKAVNKWSDTMIKQVSDGIAFPELKGITTHAELESAATKAVEAGAYDLEGKQLTVPEYLDDAAKRAVQYSKKRKPTESKRAQKKKEAPPIVEETNIQSIGGEDVSTAGIDATEISGFTIKSNDTSYKRTEEAANALRKLITMRLDKGDNLWDIYSDLTNERASAGLKGKIETVKEAPDWWVDVFSEFQDRNENYSPDAPKNIVNGYKKAQSNLRGSERGVNYIIEKLSNAARKGDIPQESADIAIDLVRSNPELFRDLALSIAKLPEGSNVHGWYNASEQLAKIFKGGVDATAVHEILHHTERFLPMRLRYKILKEWDNQLKKQENHFRKLLLKESDPEKKRLYNIALQYIKLAKARQLETNSDNALAIEGIMKNYLQELGDDFYQLYNPSEWWSVNASRLLKRAKTDASLKGFANEVKKFYRKLIAALRRVLGLSDTAAVQKGINAILNGETLPYKKGRQLSASGSGDDTLMRLREVGGLDSKPAILPTIAGAALTGYGLYHALTTGDVGGFQLAALGGFTNPNLLKAVVANTKNWLSNRKLNDNLGNPFSRWIEMNPDATIAERQKGFAEIKQEGADRIKGIAGRTLKPLEFVYNTYVNSIRKAGDKFDSYFTEKVMPLEQKYQDWITKYDVNPDLVNQVAELNVKVWDKAAEVMNDADIPVSERADEMKEEVRLMLNKEFRGKPELKAAYEAYRKAVDDLSAVELEQKALATVGWMPDEVAANEKKFMKIADDFYYEANKLEDRIKEIKGMSGGKKAFDELVQTDAEFASLYGDKAQGRKLSDKRADEYINDYTESIQTSADKLTASGDDADKLANFSLNLKEQIKMSKVMNYLPYWRALKSGMRKTYTLQRAGDENKRYRIYSKNKKGKNQDLASIVKKERLTMHLPDGTKLNAEEAAASLEQNQTQEGAHFTSPDGTEWHITEYDSSDDNYTSGLFNAMNVFLDALSSGAAGGKLSKLAGEWLNNHKDITNDTAEGRKLRKIMEQAAEGNVDYQTLKTNVELLKAQAMDDLHKSSTKASPLALSKGRDIVRGVGEHFSGISTDAERIGQTIQTSQLQIESTLKGFNDKLTSLLSKHQEQLASRTARPFFRNSIYDALTELSGIGQALVLGGNVKSGVVNVVKGSNAAISEYGFNPKSKIKTDTAKTAFNVGMEAVKPLMQLRARRRYHIDAQRFEKFKEVTSFMIAKSQDMADNFTARLATADFVSKLSEADQKALANGDAKLISDLKSAVQRGVRRTQGSFRHYNLSPMQQGLLRLPLGSAILAFTAPRINELNYVYHQIRNIKNPENFAKLARYATMTILTVGAMGLPLVTEMRGLLEAGTGDREETDYDKMLGKLKDLAKEQGVPDAWIDNARAMTEKGALANQFTNTDLMNDDALTSMANIFGVGYAANIIKSTSENFNNEDKTAAEKVLSVMAGTNPLLKGVYRGTMEISTGQKTDSKISVVPGSTADVESVVRHTLNIPSHSEAEKIRRIKHIDLTTEDGLFNAASDMIKDVQGMSTLAYKGRYITSSGKEANMDALRNMQNELIKEPDKLRSVIRKANEITADRAEDIEQTKDDLLAWLKSTDASSVKGLHTTFRKGGNMEELLNKALNGKDNPDFNSTSGIVKSIIGSPDDDKYRETSVYGMYRKKAIIEALKDSGLGIIATWKPTTKLADNQRLSGVPDKQQALEYAKNRIINLINTSTVRVTP
jgi:DNA-binding phage protein